MDSVICLQPGQLHFWLMLKWSLRIAQNSADQLVELNSIGY